MYSILLVEDNTKIQRLNKKLLEHSGYDVRLASNLAQARQSINESEPDMIVLDIMLPDGNGLDFLVELRNKNNDIPILLLTALGANEEKVHGLKLGGDDYLAKPYDNNELIARIEAILRRSHRAMMKCGAITINRNLQRAYIYGSDILLSRIEYALLLLFIQNENKTISAKCLYESAWDMPLNNNTRTLQSQISNLRKKIEPAGYSIITKREKGYCFEKA
jgi:DNA-binding response OmpR family regulator